MCRDEIARGAGSMTPPAQAMWGAQCWIALPARL